MEDVFTECDRIIATIHSDVRFGDHECAHSNEDLLRKRALEAIASGKHTKADCAKLARLALSTESLSFGRWCA